MSSVKVTSPSSAPASDEATATSSPSSTDEAIPWPSGDDSTASDEDESDDEESSDDDSSGSDDSSDDEPTPTPSPAYEPSGNIYLDVEAIYIDREQYSDGTCGGVENVIARNKSNDPEGDIYYVHYSRRVMPITTTRLKIDYDFTAVVTSKDYLLTKLDYDNDDFGFLSNMDECDEDSEIHPVAEEIGKMGQANHRYDGLRWQDS